jgi:hypothetical protein
VVDSLKALDPEWPIREEKHEPVSDIDTVVVDSLKALDPEWPIREADVSSAESLDSAFVVGSACASFSRLAGVHSRYGLHTRAVAVYRETLSEGFSHFVTSIARPVASGWSGYRVGFAPTGKRRLLTAHARTGHSLDHLPNPSIILASAGVASRPPWRAHA